MILRFAVEVPDLFPLQHIDEQPFGFACVEAKIAAFRARTVQAAIAAGIATDEAESIAAAGVDEARGAALEEREGGPWS